MLFLQRMVRFGEFTQSDFLLLVLRNSVLQIPVQTVGGLAFFLQVLQYRVVLLANLNDLELRLPQVLFQALGLRLPHVGRFRGGGTTT